MKIIGISLFVISGVVMFIAELMYCLKWWGGAGLLIGIFGGPIITVLFPFILLAKEGFSLFYFGTWAVGLVGAILTGLKGDS